MFFGCKNLSFKYNEVTVLKDISFEVNKGEFIGLVGNNGSGKSTLLKVLCGILFADKGEVIFQDKLLDEKSKIKIGYIFQNPENQIIGVTVEEDVAFGLENTGVPREEMIKKIKWALSTVGLETLEKADPNTLSGGQKQRLAIASILVMEPDVILMDEPTSMLDPRGRSEVHKVIGTLLSLGKTIIIASHHASDLIHVQRIIALNEGRIIYDGDRKAFYEKNILPIELPFKEKIMKEMNLAFEDLVNEVCQ